MEEQCRNFLKPNCKNTNITLYIQLDSDKLPICQQCWCELSELPVEWPKEGAKIEEKQDQPNSQTKIKQTCFTHFSV